MSCEDAERHTVYVVQRPHSPGYPPRQLREGEGADRSDRELRRTLEHRGHPFAWIKNVDEILAKAARELPATPGDVLSLDRDRRPECVLSPSPTISDVHGGGWTIDEAEVGIAARLALGHGKT